ncbi:MAG: FAD-dependent oxidoreductase [Solirubrobacteraceae bacterium]
MRSLERDRIGGDCLWTGCVPSKALLASARVAQAMRTAGAFGVRPVEPDVDLEAVWRRIRAIQDDIAASDDDPARYEALGAEVVPGEGRLAGPTAVAVGDRLPHTRYVLLCTGSRPLAPPVPGLEQAGYVTSESLFALERVPRSVVVVGGGPIGTEMAQGLRRLGVAVTLLQRGPRLLPREEPELAELLAGRLAGEGVDVRLRVDIERVEVQEGLKVVHAGPDRIAAEEILVATGRAPSLEALGLEQAGVERGTRGVVVDGRMRSSVPSVYAAGDAARALPVHPLRGSRGRARRARHVLPGPWPGAGAGAVVHVHRSRARPRGPHDRRGARAPW